MDKELIHNGQFNIGHICTKQQCDKGLQGKVAMRFISQALERTDYTFGDIERNINQKIESVPIFMFHLGWLGIVLSALLVRIYILIINSLSVDSGGLKKCISVYVVVSVFRWYLYSPLGLLRGVILLSIVYFVANLVSEVR